MRDPILERCFPVDQESERLVLGALMTDLDAISAILPTVESDDFGLEKHRRIHTAISEIWRGGGVPDRIAVARFLQAIQQLEPDEVGYLVDLESGMPRLFCVENYLNRLREFAIRRKILHRLYAIADMALDYSRSIDEITSALQNAQQEAIEAQPDNNGLLNFSEFIAQYPGGLDEFLSPERAKPIPTPWRGLNEILQGGWRPGELTVLAARPGLGKSAAAGQVAHHAAKSGANVAVFSLEMQNQEIWFRMFSAVGRIGLGRLRGGQFHREERDDLRNAMVQLTDLKNLRISDKTHRIVNVIERIVRRENALKPVNLVIIDYLQLMRTGRRTENRVEEVADITRELKLGSAELNCSFLVLAQLNRESVREKREPELQDLRECGSIEQDADAVMFLYQKPSDKAKSIEYRTPCPTKLLVKKQRNGPVGTVHCIFEYRFVTLEETECVSE